MRTYIVTKDMDSMGRRENVFVTTDPDNAKMVCDAEYEEEPAAVGKRKYHTFIEVWEPEADEPEFVTRAHPESL